VIFSSSKILEIHRLNKRIKVGDDYQYVLSRTICVKFADQSLPPFIYFFNCRYPVYPFVPKARICYACFRIGHLRKTCKSKPRCLFCGEPAHESSGDCPNKLSSPRCLNCGGNHLATSHDCPEVIKHKMVLSLAANENISYQDAKRSVNSSSSFPSSSFSSHLSSDPRFDFRNFPLLPQSNSQSFPPPLTNKFAPLADLPQYDNDTYNNYHNHNSNIPTRRKPYSQAIRRQRPLDVGGSPPFLSPRSQLSAVSSLFPHTSFSRLPYSNEH